MRVFLLILISLPPFVCANEICASKYSELESSARLAKLKPLFNADKRIAMVNQTRGSFVIIDGFEDNLTIRFYTSGLFDLYPIQREGPLKFCDVDGNLRMIGLDREDRVEVVHGGLVVGRGGPKRSFVSGEMPQNLKRLHKMDVRGLASEKSQ